MDNPKDFTMVAREARARLLQMHFESGVGHLGGNLSCLDTLLVLHHQILKPEDQFLLSKGHSAGALYVALWSVGRVSDSDLREFHKDGTRFSGHPAPNHLPDIPFATGSLGHGLSLASGLALAKQIKGEAGRIYCLTSDGEWQEGSTWEALIFASHRHLPLTIVVDANGWQGFGSTASVAGMDTLAEKFRAFSVPALSTNGHDLTALADDLSCNDGGVRVVIAHTLKGHGVAFLEDTMESHYLPLTANQYEQARLEVWAA